MGKKVLIALGGNALLQSGEKGTVEEQMIHIHDTCIRFLELLKEGYTLCITHGNGPQVGSILLKNELAASHLPPMPLDVCGAESQGMIGYMIQKEMRNQLKANKRKDPVFTICTQTLVDRKDKAFQKPTKPVGPFYSEKQAEEFKKEKGWSIVEQIGKGFRRVVPSPQPIKIVEGDEIKKFVDEKAIVIACGGGGIPVIENDKGNLEGIEAVIDKDLTAALLAKKIEADILMILTDVDQVALNFGTSKQKNLDKLTLKEAEEYLKEGEFGTGSMGPKVESACRFVRDGGSQAIIASLDRALDALNEKSGTHILK